MEVAFHPKAEAEFDAMPVHERLAMAHAVEKLQALGARLPSPHSSAVKGTYLRELRPRGGRSPWRALYCRIGDVMVIGAIGPEARHDALGFQRAVAKAKDRLAAAGQE